MKALKEIDALGQAAENIPVARQNQLDIKVTHLVKRRQELTQRIVGRNPAHDSGRDVLQHMIAANKQLLPRLVQANVPIVVPRRLDHVEMVVTVVVNITIRQVKQVGLAAQGQKLRRHLELRCVARLLPGIEQSRINQVAKQRVVNGGLHVLEVFNLLKGMHVGVDSYPPTPNAIKVARMVRMGMGKHNLNRFPAATQTVKRLV